MKWQITTNARRVRFGGDLLGRRLDERVELFRGHVLECAWPAALDLLCGPSRNTIKDGDGRGDLRFRAARGLLCPL
jgi:hypothetical protein